MEPSMQTEARDTITSQKCMGVSCEVLAEDVRSVLHALAGEFVYVHICRVPGGRAGTIEEAEQRIRQAKR